MMALILMIFSTTLLTFFTGLVVVAVTTIAGVCAREARIIALTVFFLALRFFAVTRSIGMSVAHCTFYFQLLFC